MRSVHRSGRPDSLLRHASRWRSDLLREIRDARRSRRRVSARFYNKYKHIDIRDALRVMYQGLCCYCEGRILDVSFDHIEHRKPKSCFPEETFNWDNLHLACEKCNIAKGDKWDDAAPILDAVHDPITAHLTYEEGQTGVRRWPHNNSRRGFTTIEHADLNRGGIQGLPLTRARVLMETMRVIRGMKRRPHSAEARAAERELIDKSEMEYGSVIAWALEEWWDGHDGP